MTAQRVRASNFELLRIFGMAIIVLQHYSGGSQWVWDRESPSYLWFNEYFINCMATCGKIGVDIFLLMTGYFLNGKPLRNSSIARTWFQTVNWSYMMVFVAYFTTGVERWQWKLALSPVICHGYWFISSYMGVSFTTGWISALVNFATLSQYIAGLIALLFIMGFSGWGLEIAFCNALWFFMTVSVGAALRRYIHILRKIRTAWLVIALLLACIINYGSVYMFTFHEYRFAIDRKGPNALTRENWSVLCLVYGVVLVLLTDRFEITSASINKVASCTLGVYLFHENMFVTKHIWNEWVNGSLHRDSIFLPIICFAQVISVYVICTALEYIRKAVFGLLEEKISTFVGAHMDTLANRLNAVAEDEKSEV